MPIKIHSIMLPRPSTKAEEYFFNGVDHPLVPPESTLELNLYRGALKWHPAHVGLLFPRDFHIGWRATRREFLNRMEAEGIVSLHAGILDGLLAHKHLISEEFKRRRTFFGGTVYSVGGSEYIRALAWHTVIMPGWNSENAMLDMPLEESEPFLIDRFRSHSVELVL